MRFLNRSWHIQLLTTLVAVFFTLPVIAEIAPAGVTITNRAEVSWFDTKDGIVKKMFSNVSQIEVAKLYALDLERDNNQLVQPGQPISLPHRLTNTGNTFSNYELQIEDQNTDSGSLQNIHLFTDINGNGVANSGEPEILPVACTTPATGVTCYKIETLQAGELTEFVLTGTVDSSAAANDSFRYSLHAISLFDTTKQDTNLDSVQVKEGATLSVNKTVAPTCGTPVKSNDVVQYSINFTNTGNATPDSRTFHIDDADVDGAILEDTLPSNLNLDKSYAPSYAPVQGQVVVQLKIDEGTNRWITYASWNGTSTVSKIGLFLPVVQMQPHQSGKLEFKLTADSNLTTGTVYNEAGFNTDQDPDIEFLSNQVCTTLVASKSTSGNPGGDNEAEIRFLAPVLDIKRSGGIPNFNTSTDFEDAPYYQLDNGFGDLGPSGYNTMRDGVYIEVHSTGLNSNEDTPEIHMVTVSSATGDSIQVAVLETGPNTGIFRSIRAVRLSATERGNGANCPAAATNVDYLAEETGCVLNSVADGNLRASINDPGVGQILTDSALIDPLGVVFDSAYNYPVAGALVTIHNADGTIAENPVTGQPYPSQLTDVDGRYQFPFLFPQDATHSGQYYLQVEPPKGYSFPSKMPAITLVGNTGRHVNAYSYGIDGQDGVTGSGIFTLLASSADLVADLPLDPDVSDVLTLDKSTTRPQVGIGDFVTYSIDIQNHSDQRDNFDPANTFDPKLYAVELHDKLPYGFRYVSGTAFLDGQKIADPVGAPGPNLTFSIFNNPVDLSLDNQKHTLTYRVRVSAGAIDGDGVNTASATSRTVNSSTVNSNTTSAKVTISQDGVLDARGIVFGKVYVDANCDGIQHEGEWPIGGVKLYMEDGTWVITDGNGQYSLYGINPGNHVIKVDPVTLPDGVVLKPTDNRHMAAPDSRLVDLTTGEFHRADFVAGCPKADAEYVFEQIQARNAGTNDYMLENAQKYDPNKPYVVNDLARKTGSDGDLSNGTVGFTQQQVAKQVAIGPQINRGYSYMVARYRSKAAAAQALANLPASVRPQAYIYPEGDLQTLRVGFSLQKHGLDSLGQKLQKLNLKATRVTTIYERLPTVVIDRLEAPKGAHTMPTPQVAIKQVSKQQAKQGIWLWPKNDTSFDGRFMVVTRAGLTPTLVVNGKPVSKAQIGERIENKRERAQIVAWYGVDLQPGENKVEVVARDMFGNTRTLVSGTFKRPDNAVKIKLVPASDVLPADGGRSYLPVTIKLLDENGYPARGTHFVTLEASDGRWVERDIQDQTPGRQVRVINGERVVHLRSSEYTGDVILRASDGHLQAEKTVSQVAALRPLMAAGIIEVNAFNNSFDNRLNAPLSQRDKSGLNSRAAIFMKGRVRGNAHLTLSYDTAKDTNGQRFRDINPNTGYPMYGDASQRGYEAQSRSKLYAKIEKGKNSLLWGDYLTDAYAHHESVARVQRSLTGANGILDDGTNRLQVYVARPEDNHITEELRGQGTALNYRISKHPVIRNSEVVEIITYSRDNPGVVLSLRQLTRFGDYTLDDITGDLSFSDSIPALDENQNPVYIRVTYDVESNGDTYTVGGIRLNSQLTDELNLGASYSVDNNRSTGKTITGVSGEYKTGDIRVTASAAALTHEDATKGAGNAYRLDVEKRWDKDSTTRFSYGRADAGYDNQSGGIAANREESRITHRQRINEKVTVNVEGIRSKQLDTDATQQSLGVTTDVRVDDWTLKGGVRHIVQHNSADNDTFNTVILGAKHPLDILGRKGHFFGEYEQDIGTASRKRIALGGDIEVHDKVKLYGRAERINSITGVSGLSSSEQQDTLSIGIKSNVLESTEMYSEYRLRGAIDGRDLETASGIRGTYEVKKGLSVSPRLEVINSLKGNGKDSVALSVGIKDTRDTNNRKLLRVETRHDSDRDYYGIEGSYVGRVNEDWSLLARDSLRLDRPDNESSKYQNTFTIGFARRPRTDNKHNMLFLYQNKLERGYDADGDCDAHILSTHQSYEIDDSKTVSGRLGGKTERCSKGGTTSSSNAVVMDGRFIWDITNRWDTDVHGGLLATSGFDELQYSAGLGINYLVKRNLRVGVGYNFKGFEEDDLDSEGYNKQGVYVGLQYKVDENSLGWLSGDDGTDADNIDDAFKEKRQQAMHNSQPHKTEKTKGLIGTFKNWFSGE